MASSGSVPGGSAGVETVGPFSIFQRLTEIHFPTNQPIASTQTISFAGSASVGTFTPGLHTPQVYLMAGGNLLRPKISALLGSAGFGPLGASIDGALQAIPADLTVWFGVLGLTTDDLVGDGFEFSLFEGGFDVSQTTKITKPAPKPPVIQKQHYTFAVPEDLPNVHQNTIGFSLGWRYTNLLGFPLTCTLPPAFEAGSIPDGAQVYIAFGLTFDYLNKQVGTANGTIFDAADFVQGPTSGSPLPP